MIQELIMSSGRNHMEPKKLPHDHGDISKVLEMLPDVERFEQLSDIFSLVSDATRLRILWMLCHCEECGCNIASAVEMSAPAVAHHLKILKNAGLIKGCRKGKEIHYSLADNKTAALLHQVIDTMLEMNCVNDN
jgi:DNA-binding transcriptional ArsR family regulator